MAMQQAQNEFLLDDLLKPLISYANRLNEAIGDVTLLGSKPIVDLLLEGGGGLDKSTQAIIDYILDEFKINYNEEFDSISYLTKGMWGNLKEIISQWELQGEELGEVSTDRVAEILDQNFDIQEGTIASIPGRIKEMLNKDYNLQQDTINKILARLKNIEEEIGTSIEQIDVDLVRPVIEGGEGLEYWWPATVGWVRDYVRLTGGHIFDAIDVVIDELSKPINSLLQSVYDISDPWLAKLKEKLGDVGGAYDLAADPVFQEVASIAAAAETVITELPDWWVSALAGKIEGYLTVGIGEKGEKGDPGVPGEQGIPGVPGVRGEKGEPGEGAGLAIDDIDRQLKGRLVTGAAIVTDNVTGVIDYNIGKIGEIFARYDLEVKPITEFLTTDMQATLTVIAESFETPEALIAFLLDVPEGEEAVTYDLMQLLIAQIMERGLT